MAQPALPSPLPLELEVDHLVVAATTLEEGVAYVAGALGIDAGAFSPEGKHPVMGTHNRCCGLGSIYLEVLAVDPTAPAPLYPRWFGLDDPSMRAQLAQRPRLLHWVVRLRPPADLTTVAAQQPQRVAPPIPVERGPYRWRLTVPADGSLPSYEDMAGGGVLPTLIQWDVTEMPAQALPSTGLRLQKLTGFHPQALAVREALGALGAGGLIEVQGTRGGPCLEAQLIDDQGGPHILR